jgi:hypothetical protein
MPETRKPRTKTEAPADGQPQAQAPKKSNAGRTSEYNQHIALVICTRIAEGDSLREIVKSEGMPDRSTVYDWLLRHPEFADQYARAREEQADTLADEIVAIADEPPEVVPIIDKRTGELIEHKLDNAYLQWQKNRIDARKWTAMKLKPRKYGEKVELTGDKDNPLHINAQVEAKTLFSSILDNLELKKQAAGK